MSKIDLQVFNNPTFGEIRVSGTSEQPLFCLTDVCKALDLSNTSMVKSRLSEKGVCTIDTLTKGGNQKLTFITESNLYKCVFQSRKPDAEAFQDWVCEEVLPSIRKNGGYIASSENDTPEMIIARALIVAHKTIEAHEAKVKQLQSQNEMLMHVGKLYNATEIAKECNLRSGYQLNKILEEKRIQYKTNNTWVMYSDYANLGYESIKQEVLQNGKVIYDRRFTQRGREFILELLKEGGVE